MSEISNTVQQLKQQLLRKSQQLAQLVNMSNLQTKTWWVCDASANLEAKDNVVQCLSKAKQSTKFNALWKQGQGLDGKTTKGCYWEVTLLSGQDGLWVGLTDESHFAEGWKCKGLLFGGNLSDGGALVQSHFGPRPKAGDVIGLKAELNKSGHLVMRYFLNGVDLGDAFDIEPPFHLPMYPLVSFNSGPASASIEQKSIQVAEGLQANQPARVPSLTGEWVVDAVEILHQEDQDKALVYDVTTSLVSDTELRISANGRGANSMSNTLTRASTEAPWQCPANIPMSRMLAPPEWRPLEDQMTNVLTTIMDVSVTASNTLRIKCEDDANSITCNAKSQLDKPTATRERIRWLSEK